MRDSVPFIWLIEEAKLVNESSPKRPTEIHETPSRSGEARIANGKLIVVADQMRNIIWQFVF